MVRVLVVDDTLFMRRIIKGILTENGYDVVAEAADGLEAIEKYKEFTPDIVTMDITMPKMDGIRALKEIKSIHSAAKVVIISAMGQEVLVQEAILNGAKSFIVKPFQEADVIRKIEKVAKM